MPRSRLGLCTAAAAVAIAGAAGALGAQWALSPRPALAIGNEDTPDYQFNRITHLRRLSDGRIIVTMGPDIRFFDASGQLSSKAGGRGGGPGEFQFISDLFVLPGDTLLTMNIRTIVVLNPEGKFVRQQQPDLSALAEDGWFGEGFGLLPNGNLLAMQYSQEEGQTQHVELRRPTLRYVILDRSSGALRPLHQSGGLAQQYVQGEPYVQAFTPHAQKAVGRDRVYVGDNDSTTIHAFDLSGRPLGTFTVAERSTPVTNEDLQAFREVLEGFWAPRGMSRTEMDQRWAKIPKPSRHPYWGTALVDDRGLLWVSGPERRNRLPISWTVFDRTGRRVSSLTMPLRFTPKHIGPDFVLGVQHDEDGVETIAMYGLRR